MTPELITNAIAAALSAGAATGATDTAKKAIADAYEGLKSIIKARFGNDNEAVGAIDKLEAKPDSEGRKLTLIEELKTIDAGSDPELISAAQSLLELIHALPKGETHTQLAHGTAMDRSETQRTVSVHGARISLALSCRTSVDVCRLSCQTSSQECREASAIITPLLSKFKSTLQLDLDHCLR